MPRKIIALEDLPPCPPDREFIYCPSPLLLTDAQLDELFPRERRIEFLRDIARAAVAQQFSATTNSESAAE